MKFSEHFGVPATSTDDWYDLEVLQDTPLYVDPFLVFDDEDGRWTNARTRVVQFLELAASFVRSAGGDRTSPGWKKALTLLTFPEPREFALGLSMGSPNGSGTGAELAFQMVEALEAMRQSVLKLEHIDAFALFCDGLGVDRLSDILCNVLKADFIKYTQDIAVDLAVEQTAVPVRHYAWEGARGRWLDGPVELPKSPAFDGGIILTPKRFLKDIPRVTPEGFWTWAEVNEGELLRNDLNFDLTQPLTRSEKRENARRLALARPSVALAYVDGVAEQEHAPYDVVEDPRLLAGWGTTGREAAKNLAPLDQPATQDAFCAWVVSLAAVFKQEVENTSLWRALWDDGLAVHRIEKIVQAVAGSLWTTHCKVNGIDISREVDAGRGPVDFKFSAGWQSRALLEIKLIENSRFFSGASRQLPQYLASEQVTCGVYVCIAFSDRDLEPDRLKTVDETLAALSAQKGIQMTAVVVDARPKKSASKLRDSDPDTT